MAANMITSFTISKPIRVRVASVFDHNDEGDFAFMARGRVFDNAKYDNRWHTFAEGTVFDVACIVDKTDTYCVLATEELVKTEVSDKGNEVSFFETEVNGVFLRRKSFYKLLAAVAVPEDIDVDDLEDNGFGLTLEDAA